jgi:hypothetical protein
MTLSNKQRFILALLCAGSALGISNAVLFRRPLPGWWQLFEIVAGLAIAAGLYYLVTKAFAPPKPGVERYKFRKFLL